MLYRRLNDSLFTTADLTGAFSGSPMFILGGNPVLKTMDLGSLAGSNLPTMALNNVPYVYPNPTIWLTADKPVCYGHHMFSRADLIKIGYMNYRNEIVPSTGRPFKDHPMMLFFTGFKADGVEDFFAEVPGFAWWKSIFPIALQLAWRLGCRRVYLVGCTFNTHQRNPYAWSARINSSQARWNQRTYDEDIQRLKALHPLFVENGFQVFSCTPDSRANEIFPHILLKDAISYELSLLPKAVPLEDLKHSSETK